MSKRNQVVGKGRFTPRFSSKAAGGARKRWIGFWSVAVENDYYVVGWLRALQDELGVGHHIEKAFQPR